MSSLAVEAGLRDERHAGCGEISPELSRASNLRCAQFQPKRSKQARNASRLPHHLGRGPETSYLCDKYGNAAGQCCVLGSQRTPVTKLGREAPRATSVVRWRGQQGRRHHAALPRLALRSVACSSRRTSTCVDLGVSRSIAVRRVSSSSHVNAARADCCRRSLRHSHLRPALARP